MKKNIIMMALAVAGGVATYLLTRKKADIEQNVEQGFDKAHHLTNVFSKAKQQAVNA
jgi:coenzyme F420-reducing hydrogenase alpha subunit